MATTISNRTNAFSWVFFIVFLAMLLAFTWVFRRDGAPPGYHPLVSYGLMALFWAGGLGLAAHVSGRPCYRVVIRRADALFVWRYPLRSLRREVDLADVPLAIVVESRDSDGDRYYHARVTLPQSPPFDLAEGHSRDICLDACTRFNALLQTTGLGGHTTQNGPGPKNPGPLP